MTKYQVDEFTVRGGKITLYRRADSPSKVYQARFMANGKCLRRSTKESNREEAAAAAGEIYDEIRFKLRHDMPIGSKNFKAVWNEWLNSVTLSDHRRTYIRSTGHNYILPFFGGQPITGISTSRVLEYWAWRELNTMNGKPSAQTLNMDTQLLRQFTKWAGRRGYLNKLPEIIAPKKVDRKATRRPAFSRDDIQHFQDFTPYWVGEARHESSKIKRGLCYAYASLILFSGLRPKEARLLQWKDVELGDTVLLSVSDEGKTGVRVVVAMPQAKAVMGYIRTLCGDKVSPEDYVFPSPSGGPVGDYKRTFKAMMTYLGLNKSGPLDRTLYSLRHTYATFRLLYGKVEVFKLASNMGTSVKQIEDHYGHVTNPNMADDLNANDQSGFANTWGESLEGFT